LSVDGGRRSSHRIEVNLHDKELTSNLIGNSHMVPSGIVAVGHAQEHGYAYVYSADEPGHSAV